MIGDEISDLENDLKRSEQSLENALKRKADVATIANYEKQIKNQKERLRDAKRKKMADDTQSSQESEAPKQPSKFAKGAKTVGKGLWTATKWTAGAGAAGASWAWDKRRNVGNTVASAGDSIMVKSDTGLTFFFLAAVIIHILDVFSNFVRPGWITFAYIALIIIAFFFLFGMRINDSNEAMFIIVIVISYLLPYSLKMLSSGSMAYLVIGYIVAIPLLPIYLGLKFPEDQLIAKVTKWYIIIWFIFLIFSLLGSSNILQNSQALGSNGIAGFKYAVGTNVKGLEKAKTTFQNSINQAMAKATGQPYEGKEESRVGIFIEDLKPLETKYSTASNVFIEGKIKGVNLKEPVNVSMLCFIEGVGEGKITPMLLTDVHDNYENSVTCNYGKLKAGTYTAKVVGTFEFESSSDIEYTFIDSNVKSDQYSKLGISSTTIATYTGGPVELGLPSLTQPLRINTDPRAAEADIATYPFGVSLKNKWFQGKVSRGLEYTLNVPAEVSLKDCSVNWLNYPQQPYSWKLPDGRLEYYFKGNLDDAVATFDAVTCRISINDPQQLLDGNIKNTKTFAARAKYQYITEATTTIVVDPQ